MTLSNLFRRSLTRLSPFVLFVSPWGCDPPNEAVQVQVAVEEPAPSASYSTGLSSDLPFGFDEVVEVRPGLMVALESQTNTIWGLKVQEEQIVASRLDHLLPGTGPVIALVREPGGIRIVKGTGSTVLLDSLLLVPVDEAAVRLRLEPAPVSSIQSAPGGGYFVLTNVLAPIPGGPMEWSPILQRIGPTGIPGEVLWRGAGVSDRDRSGLFDKVSFANWSDTIFIGRSGPPRLLLLTPDGDTISLGPLDPPYRPVTKQTKDAFAKVLRSVPRSARVGIHLPDQYPALIKISAHQGILLTVPITGDNDGVERHGLDLYCGTAFERTLLNAPELTGVFVLVSAVLAVRTWPDQGTARVDYIPLDGFSLRCTDDR